MSSFEDHHIETLSPSKIMLFASEPALFVLEHVLKRRQPVGTVAHRGAAVEHGVVYALEHPEAPVEECIAEAENCFRSRAALTADKNRDKHEKSVGQIVRNALVEMRPYGPPSVRQKRVTVMFDGLSVPVRGDFDFAWDQFGIISDLKSGDQVPGKIKTQHAWQLSLYLKGYNDNYEGRVTYAGSTIAGKNPAATYRLENPADHLAALLKVALTIQRFLAVSRDPQELVGIIAPNTDAFYYADQATRQSAFDVWGI